MGVGEHRQLTCHVRLLQGAEPWILVKHPRGSFRLPLTAELSELHRGLLEGWNEGKRRSINAEPTVRVPLALWLEMIGAGEYSPHESL
jgi:hypothetical protein